MSKKMTNNLAIGAIALFILYFIWMITSSQSSSSGLACLFVLLFGFALIAIIWLIVQNIKRGKQSIPHAPANVTKTSTPQPQATTAPMKMSNNVPDRFVQVDAGIQVNAPQVTLTYSHESQSSGFIKDAQKYHGIEGKPVEPVPFMQYWPTFQAFDAKQKKWYFFWRSEVRQGRYPQTDLSYIFVYIYEILCLVEISDPGKASEQIKTIWRTYRKLYPALDRYLPDWGGDLITVKVSTTQGIAWWWELMTKDRIHPPAAITNAIIQRAVESGKVNELPYSIWAGLNLYQSQNKFYQRFNQEGAIDRGYMKAIQAVDAHLLSLKAKKGLLERYSPPKLYPQTKPAFVSAIVPDSYPKKVSFSEARNYANSSRLGNLLASITKYAENILRKQNRFSARLSGFELEEKLQRVLDETFVTHAEPKIQEPVHINLNSDRIEALQQESELVSDMLKTETTEEAKPLYSDIAQVRALWEKLDISAKRLLLAIYTHKVGNVSQVTNDIIGVQAAPFVLIDRINNFSLPLLGDRIISVENRNLIMIADDFTDEMELIAKENSLESLAMASTEPTPDEIDDPWQRFLHQLSADEASLLVKFVGAGTIGEDEIEAFARLHGQMGNLIIDSINEKAIEQLGRTPFYPEDGSWLIEEEDLDILREIVKVEGA